MKGRIATLVRLTFALGAVGALGVQAAWAQSYASPGWYADPLRGFALPIPAGTSFERPSLSPELVRFTDPGRFTGGPVVLSVLRGVEKSGEFSDVEAFAAGLVQSLLVEGFRVEIPAGGFHTTTVAGRPALKLSGPNGPPSRKQYRSDLWIHLEGPEFLVLSCGGAQARTSSIEAMLSAAAANLRIFDPQQASDQLRGDLGKGSDLVAQLDARRLAALAVSDDLWFAVVRDGKTCGFVSIRSRISDWKGQTGLRTQILSATREMRDAASTAAAEKAGRPAGPREIISASYENSFIAAGEALEKWDITYVTNAEGNDQATGLSAIRQDRVLLITYTGGIRSGASETIDLPVGGFTLPRALAWSPARLLDRRSGERAAFAQYDPVSGKIDMRTIEAVGPRSLIIGGQRFETFEFTDSPALGAPASRVMLDGSGLPLKIERPGGEIIQRTTAEAIKTLFARELRMVKLRPGGPADQ